jgi:quercetin dioxygenase-like cupin family protein
MSAFLPERGPRGFTQRVVALAPGQSHDYVDADWADAIVLLAQGQVELEAVSGARRLFQRGDLLWLTCVPLRALHNPGPGGAVLVAISRAGPGAGEARLSCTDESASRHKSNPTEPTSG